MKHQLRLSTSLTVAITTTMIWTIAEETVVATAARMTMAIATCTWPICAKISLYNAA